MPLSAYSRKLTITLDDLRELQPMLDVSRRMAVAAARKLNREVFAALVAPGGCPIPGVRIDPEPMAVYSLKLSEPYRHGIVTLNPEDLP